MFYYVLYINNGTFLPLMYQALDQIWAYEIFNDFDSFDENSYLRFVNTSSEKW